MRATSGVAGYAPGGKIGDAEMAAFPIERDAFDGEWNYIIPPRLA